MASKKRSLANDTDVTSMNKEWDEALCPICMDHPHNAVCLVCNSYEKGCRSYICDTSYRHSHCLDRFKKLREDNVDSLPAPSLMNESQLDPLVDSRRNLDSTTSDDVTYSRANISLTASNSATFLGMPGGSRQNGTHVVNAEFEGLQPTSQESLDLDVHNMEKSEKGSNLRCPLCRGNVLGWKVVEDARKYLNLKSRSCSHESCSFIGNYVELRRHARSVHPAVHPADVDPLRQSAWRRFEHQREYNDIISAIRSTMPGAIVLGDYVIDNSYRPPSHRLSVERENSGSGGEGGRLLNTFFLFHMTGSMEPGNDLRGGGSRMLYRHRRAAGTFSRRRYLWGENLLGLQENDDDHDEDNDRYLPDLNIPNDIGDGVPPNPRRRRRLTRARSDEDQL